MKDDDGKETPPTPCIISIGPGGEGQSHGRSRTKRAREGYVGEGPALPLGQGKLKQHKIKSKINKPKKKKLKAKLGCYIIMRLVTEFAVSFSYSVQKHSFSLAFYVTFFQITCIYAYALHIKSLPFSLWPSLCRSDGVVTGRCLFPLYATPLTQTNTLSLSLSLSLCETVELVAG